MSSSSDDDAQDRSDNDDGELVAVGQQQNERPAQQQQEQQHRARQSIMNSQIMGTSVFVLVVGVLVYFVVFSGGGANFGELSPDRGVWPKGKFPKEFRVKEKMMIVWHMFQTFTIEDKADNHVGELKESFSSWVYELFGAGYTSIYDSTGSFNCNLRFNMFRQYLVFGQRTGYVYDADGSMMMYGNQESLWSALLAGKLRAMHIFTNNGSVLISRKTNVVPLQQTWEIRNTDGELVVNMKEYVTYDILNKRYRGWNVVVHRPDELDPRIAALLAGADLGNSVFSEKSQQQIHQTPDTGGKGGGSHSDGNGVDYRNEIDELRQRIELIEAQLGGAQ